MNKVISWIKKHFVKKKEVVKPVDPYWNVENMKKLAGVNDPEPLSKLKEVGYIYTTIPESKFEGCTYTGNLELVKPKPCDECMPSCLDTVQYDVKHPRMVYIKPEL